MKRSRRDIEREQEANYFALCLLMPKDMFIDQYKQLQQQGVKEEDRVEALGKIFQVHPYHVVVRIQTLSNYLL